VSDAAGKNTMQTDSNPGPGGVGNDAELFARLLEALPEHVRPALRRAVLATFESAFVGLGRPNPPELDQALRGR
jgi:hypothetical protein